MPLTYTIQVTQTGIVTATGVIVTDTVPLNTTFLAASDPHDGPDANDVLTWTVGSLDIGASRTFTLAVQTDVGYSGAQLSNTVRVASAENVTATATVTTPLTTLADLSISKADAPDPVLAGTMLTYTLVVANAGPSVAQNTVVTDTLPADVTLLSATPPYSAPSGKVVWSLARWRWMRRAR